MFFKQKQKNIDLKIKCFKKTNQGTKDKEPLAADAAKGSYKKNHLIHSAAASAASGYCRPHHTFAPSALSRKESEKSARISTAIPAGMSQIDCQSCPPSVAYMSTI